MVDLCIVFWDCLPEGTGFFVCSWDSPKLRLVPAIIGAGCPWHICCFFFPKDSPSKHPSLSSLSIGSWRMIGPIDPQKFHRSEECNDVLHICFLHSRWLNELVTSMDIVGYYAPYWSILCCFLLERCFVYTVACFSPK